ncbi:MAG: hypothetical protein HOO98_03435 [Nitrospira sp.]|nr:hypothetical protein [Nitrospira sp.]
MTPSNPRRKRNYQAHGFHALQRALEAIQDFDKWLESRGEAGKPLRTLRAQMIQNQGGESAITAHERIAIDATLKTYLYLFLIDDFVLIEQGTPVNRRDRRLFNVVLQRGPIYEAVMKAGPILNELRKSRPKKEPILLPDYLKSKAKPTPELVASGQDGSEATK